MVTVMPYERYVHYRRGKLVGVVEPDKHRFWGSGHRLVPVDSRVQLFEVRAQEALTADGILIDEMPAEITAAGTVVGQQVSNFAVRDVVIPGEIRRANEELATTRQQSQIAMEKARSEVAVLRALANGDKVLEDHPMLANIRLAETAGAHGGTVIIERAAT